MSDKQPVKIGFCGVGQMGQCAHLRNYATLDECEVVAIADIRPDRGQKVAARYGIKNVYGHFREMLARHLSSVAGSRPRR